LAPQSPKGKFLRGETLRAFGRKGLQTLELLQGCTRGKSLSSQGRGVAEISSDSGNHQCSGGIRQDDITTGAGFTFEDVANQHGIVLGCAAVQNFQRRAREKKVLGRDGEALHSAIAHFGDKRFTREGDFVEAAEAVDHKGPANAKFDECGGNYINQTGGENTEQLSFRAGGIRKWSEEIEYGAFANLSPRGSSVTRGSMGGRGEEKTDAEFANGAAGMFQRQVDANAECFEDIGRAAAGADRAVSVLGHRSTGCGGNKSGSCRDVECAGAIAASAASVDDIGRADFARGKHLSQPGAD
jgi:hypothetical protein